MTHPTHGLDPNALEAALTDREGIAAMAAAYPDAVADLTWAEIDEVLASLSQNPGTSNTGEAVVWRGHEIPIRCPYPEYGRAGAPIAYDIDPGQGSATNRLVRDWPHEEYIDHLRISDGEITPLFAALEPRASDREAVIEEIENAMLWFAHPLTDHKVLRFKAEQTATAIRKLSEVSHEH